MIPGFPGGTPQKNLPANPGDTRTAGSIPGWGRSPGEGNGNPLQYSCLENPVDGGDWWAAVHGVSRVGHDIETKPQPPPLLIHTFKLNYINKYFKSLRNIVSILLSEFKT